MIERNQDRIRALLELRPIDDQARDGRCHLLFGDGQFVVAMWHAGAWVFPGSHAPIGFEPEAWRA